MKLSDVENSEPPPRAMVIYVTFCSGNAHTNSALSEPLFVQSHMNEAILSFFQIYFQAIQ